MSSTDPNSPGIQRPTIENSDVSVRNAFKNVYDNLYFLLNRIASLGPTTPQQRSITVLPRTLNKIGPPTTTTRWTITHEFTTRSVIVQIRSYPDGLVIGPGFGGSDPQATIVNKSTVQIDFTPAASPNSVEVVIQG